MHLPECAASPHARLPHGQAAPCCQPRANSAERPTSALPFSSIFRLLPNNRALVTQADANTELRAAGVLSKEAVEVLRKEVDALEAQKASMAEEMAERRREADALRAEHARLDAGVAGLRRENGAANDAAELQDRNARLEAEVAELRRAAAGSAPGGEAPVLSMERYRGSPLGSLEGSREGSAASTVRGLSRPWRARVLGL